ncbi:hypothetical protein B4102_3585 [Heyndrickxia sporothermodurans]|uniref:Uncharacterized protein n=1 Tax=Heyndrickxia sporothermodurans TaxID=46224 RepID=A0A150KLZ7_9BACI|nr:hypothetical protein [Heyndrickxia sporothermodurans]KYC94364.1 hypothetical protein B4102_3585 [Heyndrickxia sporothermodurans]
MLNILKNAMTNENTVYLGDKKVDIKKLTPSLWKKLFETIDQLPGLIVQVLLAPKEDFYSYIISACDIAMDEVVRVVAVLSGIDEKYISENAGLDEIINYLAKTVKKNNLRDVIKNVKSLLPQQQTE